MTLYETGSWWKYDRPCMIANKAIRPPRGAALIRYDPWEAFHALQGKYRTAETLWGQFIELVRRCRQDALDRYTPSARGAALILDWSNKYGLLGVLPSRVPMIVLPPIYEAATEATFAPSFSKLWIVQRKHARLAGTWITHNHREEDPSKRVEGSRPGDAVPKSAWSKRIEQPRSLVWEWEELSFETDEANARLGSFFSEKPFADQYPQPLSEEFWTTYQEPLWAWMRSAIVFAESVELVSQYAADRLIGKIWPADREERVNWGLWALNHLASLETYFYAFGPSALQPEGSSASLLSAMARMFFQDLRARRRVFRCGACQKIFVSNDHRASYCSVTCRNTASMRRYRQHARQGARLLAVGSDNS